MQSRLSLLRQVLTSNNLDGVILTEEATVNWLYEGRYHISVATKDSCALVFVTQDVVEVLVNSIEVQRLQDEEHLVADTIHVHPWYDDAMRSAILSQWESRGKVVHETTLIRQIQQLRLKLSTTQIAQAQELGIQVAMALYETCVQLRPSMTENEIAGYLAKSCLSRDVEPVVNLIAGERRALLYRHFLPTNTPVGSYAIVSVSGRRHGQVVSATRMVHFGAVGTELKQKYEAVLRVEAALLYASKTGNSLGEVLQAGIDQYAQEGYSKEWKLHHQGGIAGYISREIKAEPNLDIPLDTGMLVAWNPTMQGVKAEDTILVGDGKVQVMTKEPEFPTTTVSYMDETYQLPAILVLPK